MNLLEIQQYIEFELNKGGGLSPASIRAKIRAAFGTLENALDWEYMDRFVSFTIDLESENPRALPMPLRVKNIEFLRLYEAGQTSYQYVTECEPSFIQNPEARGMPAYYFKDGDQYLWFDKTPEKAYLGEMSYVQKTQWRDEDTFMPWLFEQCPMLVAYEALKLMATTVRDQKLIQAYAAFAREQMIIAEEMNTQLRHRNTSYRMLPT